MSASAFGNPTYKAFSFMPGFRKQGMTPGEFIAKWRASELKERSASQEHFIDLCRLLDEPTPAQADHYF